ncbi:PREDICTED: F-box/kelch-repeat protein At3g06240-like [Fragaria vesca subsp. vesca]|uniref:F-box/kelch-repeat protein At3g06240-like n=1 Tax=Fragaria vesca subsp. vesca TaxID=101020 RepID=UPI0002C2F31C|nr:PREDICTED: F-box/kelch-repeat protein At3g06240-like [Fragaria vesca subsp. vesca]
MKYLPGLRCCFRHNKKPPVDSPAKNKEEIKQGVVELPEEIIVEILLKLPFKYMIQFSCVSKKWRSLILHDPQFSKTHYKVASQQRTLGQSLLVSSQIKLPSRYTVYNLSDPNFQSLQVLAGDHHVPNSFLSSPFKKNHPGTALGWFSAVQLLGSCNGLVCMSIGTWVRRQYFKNVRLWNPSTGFVRNLLEPKPQSRHGRLLRNFFCGSPQEEPPHMLVGLFDFVNSGFGYVNATDDYKYVVLASPAALFPLRKGIRAEIFSLRTKCWKSIDVLSNMCCNDQSGIYLNEALHWITMDVVENKTTITAFDLGNEEFRQMPLPPDSISVNVRLNGTKVLVLLGECLCLWLSNSHDIQFWVMREYNVHESWNLLYSFRTSDLLGIRDYDQFS